MGGQAQFLSLTLLILKINTTFEDVQMMLDDFFDFLLVSDFQRSVWSVPSISVLDVGYHFIVTQKIP